MLSASDDEARRFFTEHMAPSALAETGVEERLERRRSTLERTQGLTPLEVVDDEPAALSVRCRAGNGDDVVAVFSAEPAAPYRLRGVRLEARPGGGREGPPPPPPGPPLDDASAVKNMRAHLDTSAAAGRFSGVALLARGKTVLMNGAWGQADRARGTAITPTTRFNLGSIGKMFTRTAIAQLVERGKLSLDDRLSKYLPDFPNADSITIAMLCAHRSGVGDFFGTAYDAMDKAKLRHNRDYLQLIRDQPLWFSPGTSQRYSNGGYVLLGEVIAKASGEDYYDYLTKHVFGPTGMTSTLYPVEGDGAPRIARGYTSKGAATGAEADNVTTRPARGSAAGGGYSTTTDILTFDHALFAAKLCSPGWAAWVAGGPRPGPNVEVPPGPLGAAFAGGAPGIASEWQHEGDVTLIVLTNRDPETTKPVLEPLREIVRRMSPSTQP